MELTGAEEVPFIWQIAKAQEKGYGITSSAKWYPESYRKGLDEIYSNTIKSPYLQKRLDDLYVETINAKAYDLPPTPGGEIMRELIKPYAGKWVFVDFWATSCGPCRGNIMSMKGFRDLNRDNDRFTFLFITGADESGINSYNDFVDKYLKEDHSVRLDTPDMIKVRDLFDINAIPRYVLIDPEGRVADSKFLRLRIDEFLDREKIPYNTPTNY